VGDRLEDNRMRIAIHSANATPIALAQTDEMLVSA